MEVNLGCLQSENQILSVAREKWSISASVHIYIPIYGDRSRPYEIHDDVRVQLAPKSAAPVEVPVIKLVCCLFVLYLWAFVAIYTVRRAS